MKRIIVGMFIFVAVFAAALFPKVAQADSFTYDLDISYGEDLSGGSIPYLQATFDDDTGDPNTVELTLTASGILVTESVDKWYFNYDDANIDGTQFLVSGLDTTLVDSWTEDVDENNLKAGGDGYFDFIIDFSEGDISDRFIGGETLTFTLSYSGGLTIDDFQGLWSVEGGGFGPYLTAAHILRTGGGEGSDWVAAVPEPGTVLLLGSGLVGLMLYGRKRFRKETDKTS